MRKCLTTIRKKLAFVFQSILLIELTLVSFAESNSRSNLNAPGDRTGNPKSDPGNPAKSAPGAGFVTGGGWINLPLGAYTANPALVG